MQGHTEKIQYYQGSQDLPAHRYFDLNLALLMEASAGGGIDGILQSLQAAIAHNNAKEPDKANTILSNTIFNIAAMQERQSHVAVAHAATVREYQGRDVSRLSAEEVAKLMEGENLPVGVMQGIALALKKKWMGK